MGAPWWSGGPKATTRTALNIRTIYFVNLMKFSVFSIEDASLFHTEQEGKGCDPYRVNCLFLNLIGQNGDSFSSPTSYVRGGVNSWFPVVQSSVII